MKAKHAKRVGALLLPLVLAASTAFASPLVTPDVPLDSPYYKYLDKMEAMGFITDMPGGTKPYSRYKVAKMMAKVNPLGMQPYLKVYYDALCDEFSDEIAYIIVHEPIVQELTLDIKTLQRADNIDKSSQRYYAQEHNYLVNEKIKLAQPKHFPSNVALRSANLELSYQQQDQRDYAYKKINASYQPLHGDNSGYRYGDGTNLVGEMTISGSLCNDVALSVTPRFSWDKDQKGDASIKEGYVRTHLGVWGLTVGKQQLNWASQMGSAGQSVSTNAAAQNMVRIGLLEPQETKELGFFKLLGKVDFHAFAAMQEGNRKAQYLKWKTAGDPDSETNHLKFIGARLEFEPIDTFTIGLERVSHMKKFGKNWLMMNNDGIDEEGNDYGNDQNGVDWRLKLPGVQFYGAWHGEDGDREITDLFTTGRSRRYGIYFPQLTKDGSWDLQLERTWNYGEVYWYQHGRPDGNGWEYGYDIMGDAMGGDADKYKAVINHYRKNGDIISFSYQNTTWDKEMKASPNYKEFKVAYEHRLRENMLMGATLGYARIKNANYNSGRNSRAKFVTVNLKWNM